jgi:hypothetical protein
MGLTSHYLQTRLLPVTGHSGEAKVKADPRFAAGFREHSGLRAGGAWPVNDPGERRRVLAAFGRSAGIGDVDALISGSPLVEFTIDD